MASSRAATSRAQSVPIRARRRAVSNRRSGERSIRCAARTSLEGSSAAASRGARSVSSLTRPLAMVTGCPRVQTAERVKCSAVAIRDARRLARLSSAFPLLRCRSRPAKHSTVAKECALCANAVTRPPTFGGRRPLRRGLHLLENRKAITVATAPRSAGRPKRTRPPRAEVDPAAVDLLERHGAQLMAVARRYAATPEDAEDAYQRGVEILLTKAPTTDPGELLPWLRTVVKHEAFALHRQGERHGTPSEPEELEPAAGHAASLADLVERRDRLRLGAEARGPLGLFASLWVALRDAGSDALGGLSQRVEAVSGWLHARADLLAVRWQGLGEAAAAHKLTAVVASTAVLAGGGAATVATLPHKRA